MTLLELARFGMPVLVRMARERKLAPGHVWTAIKGAAHYHARIAAGDVCTSVNARKRAEKCDRCPRATYEKKNDAGATAVYCGPPILGDDVACGCLVAVLVNGQVYPGAKTLVASESCPDNPPHWGMVPTAKADAE